MTSAIARPSSRRVGAFRPAADRRSCGREQGESAALLGIEARHRHRRVLGWLSRRFIQSGQRNPASVRDPHAGNLDHPAVHPHGLTVRSREAVVDQAGQHVDVKSVREQRFPSAAAAFDEHLKRTALVGTERHGFGNITCPTPWRERAVAPG